MTGRAQTSGDADLRAGADAREVTFAVLTASDRRASGEAEDTSGPAVRAMLENRLGARCLGAAILPDDHERLAAKLADWADHGAADGEPPPDLICTTGGTGLAPRDVTPEATRAILHREHTGIPELMRLRCLEHSPHTYLSRAAAGTRNRTLVINLPGSERGAVESLEAILDVLPHAIRTLRGEDHRPA